MTHRVGALLLRGVCLMRPSELHWMYGGGAAALKPRAWQAFLAHLAPEERGHPLLAYYRRLLSKDASTREQAVRPFSSLMGLAGWEAVAMQCVGVGARGDWVPRSGALRQ